MSATRNTDLINSLRAATPFPDAVSEIICSMVLDAEYDEFNKTLDYFDSAHQRLLFLINGRPTSNAPPEGLQERTRTLHVVLQKMNTRWQPFRMYMRSTPWLFKSYRADVRILHELINDAISKYKIVPSRNYNVPEPQHVIYMEEEI